MADKTSTQNIDVRQSEKKSDMHVTVEEPYHDLLDTTELKLLWISNVNTFSPSRFHEHKEDYTTAFQQKQGLPVTKEIDKQTAGEIRKTFESTLDQPNLYPESIKTLKRSLNRLGFAGIKVTGNMGSHTMKRVNEFQLFYRLSITESMTAETLGKIIEIETTPMQLGNRHHDMVALKEILNMLGFGPITLTDKYGKRTRTKVKEFQKAYNYPVNGMIDKATEEKIREVFFLIVNTPKREHRAIRELKKKLNCLGFGKITESKKLGPFAVKKIEQFQTHYQLNVTGDMDNQTFDKMMALWMSPLRNGKSHASVQTLKEDLTELGYGPFKWGDTFDVVVEKKVKQFQKTYQLPISGIADDDTLEMIREALTYKERIINRQYSISIDEALDMQMDDEPVVIDDRGKRSATREEMEWYLNPSNLLKSKKDRLQFLNLTLPEVANVSTLNHFLKDKGALAGKGQQFIDAGKEYGINEVFLISKALQATDDGASPLVKGVSLDDDGQIIYDKRVTEQESHPSIRQKVYNVYGLSEGTEKSLESYAHKATVEKWYTIDRAIVEGALLLKDKHISNGLDTFYKMRWNPEYMAVYKKAADPSDKDVAWAVKQLDSLYDIYEQLDGYTLYLDIPNYE